MSDETAAQPPPNSVPMEGEVPNSEIELPVHSQEQTEAQESVQTNDQLLIPSTSDPSTQSVELPPVPVNEPNHEPFTQSSSYVEIKPPEITHTNTNVEPSINNDITSVSSTVSQDTTQIEVTGKEPSTLGQETVQNEVTGKEPRKWRHRRSPNDKNDNKAPFNLRRLSDADFQALPPGSRLFLGNLSTHSTSKKELYDIFSPYGEILQISIKNSFGFIQYDNPDSVVKAITKENGRVLHGLKLGLEISYGKPWHHPPQGEGPKQAHAHRPDKHWAQRGYKDEWYGGERAFSPPRGHQMPPYTDRRYEEYEHRPNEYRRTSYDGRPGYEYQEHRDYRTPPDYREEYKPEHEYRPRDERAGYRRGAFREEHREERYRAKPYRVPSRDYVDRRQGREYPPYRGHAHDEPDEDFPLPRRQGNEVPECQIIVLEEIERNFIWQVETAFREAAITVHILHLSRKKLPIPAVIRQMIVEGVHAVIFLERHHEITARVNMQIFDQSRAARDSNVKYDEYENIRIEEAVGLLLRARAMQRPGDIRPPDNLLLGQPPMQPPQTMPLGPQPGGANPNPNLLGNVNFAALANLLGSLQQQQPGATGQPVQPVPMIPPNTIQPPGSIQPTQPTGMLPQQQPPNIDVQQLLRQLAPQNPAVNVNNQPSFIPAPHPIGSNLASNLGPPPTHFNPPMVGQPPNAVPPNTMQPSMTLSQQTQHPTSNIPQFTTQINPPANVTDLMAQLNQYSNQH
ncbi:8474_t:CDS:2 [Paraglomus occultum]|uniref:8474_t:CDS:1 n=1 Tax=Paraglomus occultum TaxID=144539 RepID=A0A9N9AGX0_9GLOM|nr:8474_t:CDS:2 [Paraglomus occultum]